MGSADLGGVVIEVSHHFHKPPLESRSVNNVQFPKEIMPNSKEGVDGMHYGEVGANCVKFGKFCFVEDDMDVAGED